MLLMMLERGMVVDKIIFCDTGMEFPQMYEHIKKVDEYIFKNYNKRIEIIKKEDFNMKKWAVIESNGMDEWMKVYESKEKAIEVAENNWQRLTQSEKKKQTITVGLVNVDADGEYYEDEDGNIDADIYEIALTLNYDEEVRRYNEEMDKRDC